jgi:DNA topoisomerase-2
MYIGSTNVETIIGFCNGEWQQTSVVPGLLKIINEVIDNSVDEYIRTDGQHANKISIDIEGDKITVSDNGRGIPIEDVTVEGTDETELRPVLAWTRARAGSNFSDDERTTIGMNGVGSFCTNVFSTEFTGETCDGSDRIRLTCTDGGENAKVKHMAVGKQGTKVSFIPDFDCFGIDKLDEAHIESIKDRLTNLAVCFPGISFYLNKERITFKNLKTLSAVYGEHNISYQDDKCILIIGNSGESQEFRFLSYVNGLNVRGGGSHIDFIVDKIVSELRPMIKKKHKIEVQPAHIKQNLLLINYTFNMANPSFDSQTKEKITNSRKDIENHFDAIDYKRLATKIINTEEIITPIIESILAKKELADRLALARAQKKRKKRVVKHIEAQSNNPEDKTLFITEGLSAIGPLIDVRDSNTVGGYPLKGKIMNTRGMKPVDIVKNAELSELMTVLNLQYGQPANDLTYGKIAILTDADTDGAQIACLLVNFFSHWEELFEQGRVFITRTPLIKATKGKQEVVFYTIEEFKAANLDGYDVEYYKGLGSLEKEQYRDVINNPKLIQVTAEESKQWDWLELAFGNDTDARKDWLASN